MKDVHDANKSGEKKTVITESDPIKVSEENSLSQEEMQEIASSTEGFRSLGYTLAIMQLVEKVCEFTNQMKKVGGKDIDINDFKKFVHTNMAIGALDYRDASINVKGFNYPLTDYKVHNFFTCFKLPRGVYAEIGTEFKNLQNYVLSANSNDLDTPAEYKQFQERVLVKFKIRDITWSTDMDTLSQPITLTDALGILGRFEANSFEHITHAQVHCNDIDDICVLPIQITADVVNEDMYYNIPWNVWIDNFAHNFVARLISA